jgi:hypothetical protein
LTCWRLPPRPDGQDIHAAIGCSRQDLPHAFVGKGYSPAPQRLGDRPITPASVPSWATYQPNGTTPTWGLLLQYRLSTIAVPAVNKVEMPILYGSAKKE